jgi:hypothetical protein
MQVLAFVHGPVQFPLSVQLFYYSFFRYLFKAYCVLGARKLDGLNSSSPHGAYSLVGKIVISK